MSDATEWANRIRREATNLVNVTNTIDSLYEEMKHNASKHHEAKYAAMEPPEVPPVLSVGDELKQWLEEAGSILPAPAAPPVITSEDYWQLALVLNGVRTGFTDEQKEALYWGAN